MYKRQDEKLKIAFQQAAFEDEKEEIEVAIGEERYPVSYTHLDVYKRQSSTLTFSKTAYLS